MNEKIQKYDNPTARDLIIMMGVEQAVTTIRPAQMIDESTAAKWDLCESAILDLMQHLKVIL